MMSQATPPPWKHLAKESIWGNRGLIKISTLLLPLSIILTLEASGNGTDTLKIFLQVFVTVLCWLTANIFANDLADAKHDRLSGKSRWINRLPSVLRVMIVPFLFGMGLCTMVFSRSSTAAVWVYVLALAVGFMYSLKPLRLKERGIWGLSAYSLACALGYAVLPWTWLSVPWKWLLLLAPAVFLDKWTNLHFHQIIDYPSDLKGGGRTYAVQVGPDRARKTLKVAAGLAAAWSFAVFLFVLRPLPQWRGVVLFAGGGAVLGCGVYAVMRRQSPQKATPLVRELSWIYLGLTCAVFRVIPLILMIRLSLREPGMWAAAALTILIVSIESWFFLRYRDE